MNDKATCGPYTCEVCQKEFLSQWALGEHKAAKYFQPREYEQDVWDKAAESGEAVFVPVTPGGTILVNLASRTEQGAIDNLLQDAAHMPYHGWSCTDMGCIGGFKERGYEICKSQLADKETDT